MDEWPQALYTDEPSVDDYDTAMNAILREFYENDKYKDITFIVAKTEVPANEIIVKVRSPVLKAMLESPTRNSTGKVALDDLILENFKKFIEFLYTNDCSITGQNVFGLYLL
uniref:BTB domain-containing protein n=1 Tax=Panagrolaimus sp. PS1159 TaxID=55785 RepID=A0AC35EYA3_9BILA